MLLRTVALVAVCVLAAGCAGAPDSAEMAGASNGFIRLFLGLIHGVIAPFALLANWFDLIVPGTIPGRPQVVQSDIANDPFYLSGFLLGFALWSIWWWGPRLPLWRRRI